MSAFYEVDDFLNNWGNLSCYADIVDACENFLDEVERGNDDYELEVETLEHHSGQYATTTFNTDSDSDKEFIEFILCEAEKRIREDSETVIFYVDKTDTVRALTRQKFCEKFHLDIPFQRFYAQGLPEPEGVYGLFDSLDAIGDCWNDKWKLDAESEKFF